MCYTNDNKVLIYSKTCLRLSKWLLVALAPLSLDGRNKKV